MLILQINTILVLILQDQYHFDANFKGGVDFEDSIDFSIIVLILKVMILKDTVVVCM